MISMTSGQMIQLMGITIFMLGIFTFLLGMFVLVLRTYGRDVRQVSEQTQQLVEKGIAEDVSGLVGNATALLEAMQGMVKSARSVGMFITLLGCVMMGSGYFLISQTVTS